MVERRTSPRLSESAPHANDRLAAIRHRFRHGPDDEASGRVGIDDDG
jgi:hypothetical protein